MTIEPTRAVKNCGIRLVSQKCFAICGSGALTGTTRVITTSARTALLIRLVRHPVRCVFCWVDRGKVFGLGAVRQIGRGSLRKMAVTTLVSVSLGIREDVRVPSLHSETSAELRLIICGDTVFSLIFDDPDLSFSR